MTPAATQYLDPLAPQSPLVLAALVYTRINGVACLRYALTTPADQPNKED